MKITLTESGGVTGWTQTWGPIDTTTGSARELETLVSDVDFVDRHTDGPDYITRSIEVDDSGSVRMVSWSDPGTTPRGATALWRAAKRLA